MANPLEIVKFSSSSPETLLNTPEAVVVTSTWIVQVANAKTVNPPTVITPAPEAAVIVAKVHVWDAAGIEATTIPVGSKSVNPRRVSTPSLSLLSIVNVRVLVPPCGMLLGEKLLLNPGRSSSTVRVATAVPLLPALEFKSPDVFTPVTEAVTFTSTVQLLLAPSFPPVRLMLVPPSGAATTASVQVVVATAGVAIVIPNGKMSVNARSLTGDALASVMVNVRVAVLHGPIVAGLNDLAKLGGCAAAGAAARRTRAGRKLMRWRREQRIEVLLAMGPRAPVCPERGTDRSSRARRPQPGTVV